LRHPDVAVLIGADVELLEVIKAVLMEEARFHIVTATAPELVMPLIEATAPGVIVLDLNLPEQSGWGILAALRQDARFLTLPVLLLSAVSEDAEHVAAQHDPYIELILKPFDLDAVLQRVQHLVRKQTSSVKESQDSKADAVEGTSLPSVSPRLLLGDLGK
jgi:DNA-binding response OmpR family regulator